MAGLDRRAHRRLGKISSRSSRQAGVENLEERMVKRRFIDPHVLQVLRDTTGEPGTPAHRDTRE